VHLVGFYTYEWLVRPEIIAVFCKNVITVY
jgi:hypothetical protein